MPFPTATPVLSVGGTFSTGDYVGTSGTAIVFAGCGKPISASQGGGGGYILSATLIDAAVQSVAAELWLFNTAVTPPTDNAAWGISDADAKSLVAIVPFSTYYAAGTFSSSSIGSLSAPVRYECAAADTALYGCLVTRGAPVYPTGSLTVKLNILQDE